MRIPRRYGAFPRRDDIVEYLAAYERWIDVTIHRPVRVSRIDPAPEGWRLETPIGEWRARQVIVATGNERERFIPAWPGREDFPGTLIHSADFGNADRFRGKRVLVVGAGNSGVDLLNHLIRVETEEIRVSVRNGPAILPTRIAGFPLQLLSPLMVPLPAWAVDAAMAATERLFLGNLRKYGLPRHPDGVATRLIREGVAPAFDDGFVKALKAGRVAVVPEIARFEGGTVHFAGGESWEPDAVICATGYRPGLEELAGHVGVLNEAGRPTHPGTRVHPEHPGLWFMGMTPRLPGVFYAARGESRALARVIHRALSESPGKAISAEAAPVPGIP
jgi:cation diffusion facilitator CzcD-associated flavoprotein CzcO